MSTEKKPVEDPELAIESALSRTESYIERHFKTMLIAVGVIVVVVGGYFGYKNLIAAPAENKASFIAEQNFQVDSFALALNGTTEFEGFLSIIDNYGSTAVGNIANHYAGICYLKLNDLDNALKYLSAYKATEGKAAVIVNAQNIGLIGDINIEKGNVKEGVKFYEKAATYENDFTSPLYLKKAGMAYEQLGDNAKALEAYNKIKNQFAVSLEARDIDKFIGRIKE
ncbi:MAG: tetratricopeptide repeat protein [Rikenellaceae bacterium]